ncbi:MAG: glycosyl hydrolase family 28 protein, partial [Chitinophagaceae bacterium]
IFFEGGKIHYPGIIELKSNQTLYIESGAIVMGVVKAKDAKNIRIAGYGILDGTNNKLFNDEIIKTGDTAKINANKTGSYQRFIELDNCDDVTVEGITLHNSTSWQIVPVNCRNINIRNIKIISDNASDDGIDVVHSRKVTIENSFIRTKDDCIVLKAFMKKTEKPGIDSLLIHSPSTYKTYSTQTVQDVEGVNVRHCVIWNALWGNAIEIGFELNGAAVKNIQFSNCDIIHVEAGAVLSIHNAGRSTVSDILFENIRIEDARQKLFDLAIVRSQYSEDGTHNAEERKRLYLNGAWDGVLMVPPDKKDYHAPFRGQIRNVIFRDIIVTDGIFPYSVFYGFDANHLIENIVIENMTVHSKKVISVAEARLYLENTKQIIVK